ncbi:hypothetical protein EGW08_004458 [Elysia chlorotica]|uniref:carbonic anhydrase n=1 Tax=Elysia chlorotica TaxID=188477 RepID=A0A3S1BGI1_ELYCH|nr:hypothetical protein EGW08_004458 [Elysia chlorotica]
MESKLYFYAAIVLIISPLVVGDKWGYSGKTGPAAWAEEFKKCAGRKQSPIDIRAEETMYDPGLKDFAIWFDPPRPNSNFTVKNNGHTLQVDLEGEFYVSNGGLQHLYKAAQFHFHWGGQAHHGSEHLMEGKASPLELHLVTYNSDVYSHIGEAAPKSDGLAVLGVMFEISKDDNPAYASIIKAIQYIRDPHKKLRIRLPVDSVSIRSILPADISRYFRYQGSLTTPHCHESVVWTVFKQKQTISAAQLKQFRTLLQRSHHHHQEPEPRVVPVEDARDTLVDSTRRRRSASKHHSHLSQRERDILVELGIQGDREEEAAYIKQARQARAERDMYAEMGMFGDQPAADSLPSTVENQITKADPSNVEPAKVDTQLEMERQVIIDNYRPVQPLHDRVVYRSFKLSEPPVDTARAGRQGLGYVTVDGEKAANSECDGASGVWASSLVMLAALLMALLLVE